MGYADHLAEARHALDSARRALAEEIADYPSPIAGCDAQFNHLLATHERIAAAMTALDREEPR